jgi:hypothetical protein
MSNMTSISEQQIAEDALRVALAQPYIPTSPGQMDGRGTFVLCAAACFAAAGLERVFGASERADFEREIGCTRDKAVVYRAFERLGWPASSCAIKMEPNDAASLDDRPRIMRRLVARSMTAA